MKNLVAFLFGWLIAAALLIPQAHAAVVVTPTVPGLAGGSFGPVAGAAVTEAGFSVQGAVTVSGKVVQIPGVLPLASNAADFARSSLFSNPWLIGAALLAWPSSAGIGSDQVGGWQYTPSQPDQTVAPTPGSSTATGYQVGPSLNISMASSTAAGACYKAGGSNYNVSLDKCTLSAGACVAAGYSAGGCYDGVQVFVGAIRTYTTAQTCPVGYYYYSSDALCHLNDSGLATGGTPRPATQEDFDALPAPPVAAYGDLAAQLPVPVSAPVYQPLDVAIGDPYKMPDGSTVQTRAAISPASNGQVNIVTYEMPLTDAQGQPVTNPQPTPNPDPQPTDCQLKPDSVGCTPLGTPPEGEVMPSSTKQITFEPVAIAADASCPAPIAFTAFGKSMQIDYSPACTYASGIKPVVIAVGYLTAAFIIFGIPRSQS